MLHLVDSPAQDGGDNQGDAVHNGLHPHTAIEGNQAVHEKQDGNVQNALSQNGAQEGFLKFSHSLKLNNNQVAKRHKGHGYDHPPEKGGAVGDCDGVFDENGGQRLRENLVKHDA